MVDRGRVDAALEARIEALTSSGLVNAAANRRALRIGQEPLDIFREYMATFCAGAGRTATSAPRWSRNLEEHWNAHERNV